MPINLGEIHFGLGPDTTRLRRAVQDVTRFSQAVNRASQATTQGAAQTTAAMLRQERAMVSAFQKVNTYQAAVQRLELTQASSRNLYNQSTAALNQLTGSLGRGQVSALNYQRAMERFNLSMQRATIEMRRYDQAQKEAMKSNIIGFLQRVAQSAVLIAGPLSGAAARFTVFASIVSNTGLAIGAIVAGVAAAGYVFGKLGKSIIDTTREFQAYELTLVSVTGSLSAANEDFDKLLEVARKTGTGLGTLTKAWARMQAAAAGTNLEGDRSWQIFERVAFASAKLGSSSEETMGVMRALEQIMSKGVVQSEELRGQLGDRLPGAVQIMAEALGIGTKELQDMTKEGKITADALVDFVDRLAKRLGVDTTKAIDTVAAAEGRLNTEWNLFLLSADDIIGVTDAYQKVIGKVASALKEAGSWLRSFTDAMEDQRRGAAESMPWWEQIAASIRLMRRFDAFLSKDQLANMQKFEDHVYGWGDAMKDLNKEDDFFETFRNLRKNADNPLDPFGGGDTDTEAQIRRRTKRIRDSQQAIEELQRTYETLFMAPGQQEWYQMQSDITKGIADFADRLADAGVSAQVASPLIAQYAASLRLVEEAQFAAEKTVTAMELLSDSFLEAGNSAIDAFVDAAFTGENMLESLGNIAEQTAKKVLSEFLKLQVIAPLMNSIFGSGLPTLGGIFGTGASATPFYAGLQSFATPAYHKGTRFATPNGGQMRIPRLHDGYGMKRDEFMAILQEGEQVIPRGGSGGSNQIVTINNYSNEPVTEERTQDGPDQFIEITVGRVFDDLRKGRGDGLFRSRYGINPSQRRGAV